MTLHSDYVLWFFSTCAQTFGSLVSVFGMFVLYRLQIEEGRIGHLRERMIGYHEAHRKLPFTSVLRELGHLEREHRSRNEIEHAEAIRLILEDYVGATSKRIWLESSTRTPILTLVALIFLSLLLLVLYPFYQTSPIIAIGLMTLTLVISAVPLWKIGIVIFRSIRND